MKKKKSKPSKTLPTPSRRLERLISAIVFAAKASTVGEEEVIVSLSESDNDSEKSMSMKQKGKIVV